MPMLKIDESNLEILERLYEYKNQVKVLKVKHKELDNIYCLKKVFVSDIGEANTCNSEMLNLVYLDHPNILKIVSYWLGGKKDRLEYICILTEFLEDGDLEKSIISRKNSGEKFSEEEAVKYLKILVDALVYMQEKGFAHRDIKPSNIFLTDKGNTLKLGDLGSSLMQNPFSGKSLVGTPMFLSPLLKKALKKNKTSVIHNPYKSDVFSLGLTLLYMCTFADLMRLYKSENFSLDIEVYLKKMKKHYGRLEPIVRLMLCFDENERCDFLALRDILFQLQLRTCHYCKLDKNSLRTFGDLQICYSCTDIVKNLSELEFEMYSIFRLHISRNHKVKVGDGFRCLCGEYICRLCKENKHEGMNCFAYFKERAFPSLFRCVCGTEVIKSVNSTFFTCENLVHCFCVVCGMLFNEKDHSICGILYCTEENDMSRIDEDSG